MTQRHNDASFEEKGEEKGEERGNAQGTSVGPGSGAVMRWCSWSGNAVRCVRFQNRSSDSTQQMTDVLSPTFHSDRTRFGSHVCERDHKDQFSIQHCSVSRNHFAKVQCHAIPLHQCSRGPSSTTNHCDLTGQSGQTTKSRCNVCDLRVDLPVSEYFAQPVNRYQ